MLAAQDVAERCKQLGINALHIKLHATGGTKTETPRPAQAAVRALARSGMKIVVLKMSLLPLPIKLDEREDAEGAVFKLLFVI
ncbi:unnamed protein product [Haemonchus placei]|uniref:40S ribosomal protein S14 n=1 Tax=Haemonchus placei TaxID=6290 RepID=A0A0N4WUT5_HAEPC|nr:unnamed protein product [Haemonchus placei]